MILRQVFGVTNENVLVAAILHDAIEDTTSDFDDLESAFGFEIASWVGLLSKDKRMPEEKRELAYRGQLRSAPPEVKLIKLADIYDNILDSESSTKANPTKTRNNAIKHLKNLKETNNAAVSKAITIVETLICQEKKGQNKGR
jgi:guanosine-3',5'-bis(diphosphate) 3'-pyrophosphohydrolase